ncbi:hypothetical protein OROGR_019295 [Orobanche gracilis]
MEEDEEVKAILRETFGDSSSDSDGESSPVKSIFRETFGQSSSDSDGESSPSDRQFNANDSSGEIARPLSIFVDTQIWELIAEINGLSICREFFSADQQYSLLSALEKEGYFADASHNQAMRFGDLPLWANAISYIIRESILLHGFSSEATDSMSDGTSKESCLLPSDLIWRNPLFDQFIVNIYQPGEGICAHVDLARFEDGIAIISLESSCVMLFSSVEAEARNTLESSSAKTPVLLNPGSLVLMWGEARYLWKHEINRKPGFQVWQGLEINQKRRVSVTLRRLCRTE